MENQNELHEEEVVNPEQFQVGRNPEEQKNQERNTESEDAGYTPGETEFADGEGSQLERESGELENDDFETDHQDADFENPDDDPA